ncbi:MAG: T9SS type A sorting domain-containing protein [Saprospiraceae bacterium]|nr:T9SS type A sorting domain-containing protein [Saprospiraceae bacterium]
MQKLILTLSIIIYSQIGYAQVLDHFIPPNITNSTETIVSHKVEELTTPNTKTTFSATYNQAGIPKASVKAAVYDLTQLDYDEKEYKNSLGFELVDIGSFKLQGIVFPILEFDDEGQHQYMTQFSVMMKDYKTYELQNFFDLNKYDDNTRQLRYIISSSDWGAIVEILSYFFHQTTKSNIIVTKSSSPTEKIYLEDYDFSDTEGYLIVYAVGQKPEKMNLNSEVWKNGKIEKSKDYLVNSRGSRYLRIDDLPVRKTYQRITITDSNNTVILDHEMKEEKEIKISDFEDTTIDDHTETPGEKINGPIVSKVSVFPSVFSNQITVLLNKEGLNNNSLKTIAIMNQAGEPVEILKTNENEVTINTSYLNRGIYFVQCLNGKSISTQIISKM